MEIKLQDLIAQYDAYANAEGLEEQKRQKGEQRDKLNEHKGLLEEYRTSHDAYNSSRLAIQDAIAKSQGVRKPFMDIMSTLSGRIAGLEAGKNAELKGIMESFAREVGFSTTDRLSQFIDQIEAAKGRYNLSAPAAPFDASMDALIQSAKTELTAISSNPIEGTIKSESAKLQQAEARMQSVIDELRGEGLWDDTSNRPNKTKTQIDGEIRAITAEISTIDTKIRNLSGATSGSTSPEIRTADGTLKLKSAIEGRKAQVAQMGKHIADKGEKTAKIPAAETTRVAAVKRIGIPEDAASKLKPKDGKLDASAQTALDTIVQKVADTQVSFDAWKARINPRYSIEIKDSKMLIKEGTRVEAIIDPSKPAEAAKLLEKFGRR